MIFEYLLNSFNIFFGIFTFIIGAKIYDEKWNFVGYNI